MRFRRPWAQMDDELSADFVEIGRSRRMGLAPQVLFAFLGVSGIYCIRGETQLAPQRALAERDPEIINCQLEPRDAKSKVMLMSTSIEGPAAVDHFVDMVSKLPTPLQDLKVLLLEDAGLLKHSFWSEDDPNFYQAQGLNYQKLTSRSGFGLNVEKVREWTEGFRNLDGGWCSDNAQDAVLRSLFPATAFSYLSIFEACANQEQAKALFQLQSQHLAPKVAMSIGPQAPCVAEIKRKLEEVDIIFLNGGNPDLLGFVLMKFAPMLGDLIASRVRSGQLVYLGRSAGAMVGSSDFAYSYEPMPLLLEELLEGDTKGLALAGRCVARPHYENLIWNIPARVMALARHERSVFIPNGEGLVCAFGSCQMLGVTSKEGEDIFKSEDFHLERVYNAFESAYRHYAPPRPNLAPPGKLEAPKCGYVANSSLVMLASSGLEDPDAQEAFTSLLSQLPAALHKALVLHDGSLLLNSFWDPEHRDFLREHGTNHLKAGFVTELELVREATQNFRGLEGAWMACADCFTLPHLEVHHVSVFDRCATEEQKKALFRLQSFGVAPEVPMKLSEGAWKCLEQLDELLEDSAVVLVAPGDVDLLAYVYKSFAPQFSSKLLQRVSEGSLIYLGLGAGGMLGSASFGLTVSPKPQLQRLLLEDMTGFRVSGSCALRPHWKNSTRLWDLTATLYATATELDVVGLEDGDVLVCQHGACRIRGRTGRRGALTLGDWDASRFRGRIDDVMAASLAPKAM